jgi:anhydro-N-acetylmuramic acid kinase
MSSSNAMTAIGLMAGTSLDGVDAAMLTTDGETIEAHGPTWFRPYSPATRAAVVRATRAALEGRDQAADIVEAADLVTSEHIAAVRDLLSSARIDRSEVDVVGFHGQTILHRPPIDRSALGRTWQIGGGGTFAYELGIETVSNFRGADMANGGEGAPLAPIYHAALAAEAGWDEPVCVLNLGGVANLTFVPPAARPTDLVAFDCGPGNGLLDEWLLQTTGERMDTDGALAAAGTVDEEALALMALSPYLKRQPPKSLDRYDFKLAHVAKLGAADGAATLTAFTAQCVAKAVDLLPAAPARWIVCGGGRHNPVMMAELRQRVPGEVLTAEDVGWRGDMIEAECFAYLAVRCLRGLPISFPKTTRAPRPLSGGVRHSGRP